MHELLHLAARTDDLDAIEVAEIRERIKLGRKEFSDDA
jgi:DNA-binding transcriptional regulator YiaG